jgi:hypothetical protein
MELSKEARRFSRCALVIVWFDGYLFARGAIQLGRHGATWLRVAIELASIAVGFWMLAERSYVLSRTRASRITMPHMGCFAKGDWVMLSSDVLAGAPQSYVIHELIDASTISVRPATWVDHTLLRLKSACRRAVNLFRLAVSWCSPD